MAIITYPLDGIDYSAADAETYLCTRTSGVFSAENNFRARVAGNRQVEISNGLAWVQNTTFKGKSICVTAPVTVDIPLADGSLPRKDRIVLRFDKAENRSKIILIEGEPSSSARAPEIQRTEQIYDLGLCIVDVPPSSLTVSAEHITSTLLDESVCGLMRDGVTQIPTSQLQEQVVALLADLRKAFEAQLKQQDSEFDASLEEQEQEFRTWFDTIKDIIGDDPLTQFADEILNLQNAVGGNAYFAGKGKSVTVRGFDGVIKNVIAHGFTEQAGSGDPSPDNVREISVLKSLTIKTQGAESKSFEIELTEPLCEGDTFDTNGTEKHVNSVWFLTGDENFSVTNEGQANCFFMYANAKVGTVLKCSHLPKKSGISGNSEQSFDGYTAQNSAYMRFTGITNVNDFKAFLRAEKEKGTPVTFESRRKSPVEYTHDPVEITAVPSDDGTFKVSADCELSVYQKNLQPVAFTGSYKDLKNKPTAADIGALGATEKAASAKAADAASGYAFYMGYTNKNAGIEAQETGVRLSWGTEYSYKLFFGQDPTYGDALGLHASSNGTYALGNSTARWATIYSTNGTIQTSDATRKEQITALGEKQLALFDKLRPVSYKLKSGFDDAENHDRLHYGFIAQEVEQAMAECDISAMEFGGLCKDKEVVLAKTLNEDGTENVVSQQTGADVYSLRYQEFIALNTAAIQALKAEIAELKNQLNKLTEQLK